MENKREFFFNKKCMVSFVLSLFVFLIHFSVFSEYKDCTGFLRVMLDAGLSLTHVAVPLFFLMSGALFFRDYSFSLTLKKWKSRFFSLCIPYLFWNTVWFLVALLGYYTPLGAYTGGVKVAFSPENAFRGIFLHEQFYPFWFMLQLITSTALCPVIYLIVRSKRAGLAVILGIYFLHCFGVDLSCVLLPNMVMLVFYMLGAWIGVHYYDVFTAFKKKRHALICAGVYMLCCAFMFIKPYLSEKFPFSAVHPIVLAISSYAFWNAFDCFEMRRCPKFARDSFLIYAMHSLVGATVSKMIGMLLPAGQIFQVLSAALSFALTAAGICVFGRFLDKYAAGFKRILAGR